jgi:two-component system sensor histidine kinase RpfC
VEDTGRGVDPGAKNTLFQPFIQGNTSDTRQISGTGLGTTISKQLVEAMGGKIGFDTERTKGALFWFELPLEQIPQLESSPVGALRVLLLSDDNRELTDLRESLALWDIEFELTETASEAVINLENAANLGRPFHAIIINKQLMDIDLTSFNQVLGRSPKEARGGVILVSNEGQARHAIRSIRNLAAFLLEKPISRPLLFSALHAIPRESFLEIEGIPRVQTLRPMEQKARKLKLLVAEDNAINQKVIRHILEGAGHSVDMANDGEEALNMIEQEGDYDLVIMDMQMPNLAGIDAIKLYRFMYPGSTLPFIIVTANATTDAQESCRDAGVDLFLTKPVNSRELLDSVVQVTSGKHFSGTESASH